MLVKLSKNFTNTSINFINGKHIGSHLIETDENMHAAIIVLVGTLKKSRCQILREDRYGSL